MELEEDFENWRVTKVKEKKGNGVTLISDTAQEIWWRWNNMGRSIWKGELHALALWENYDCRVFYLGQNENTSRTPLREGVISKLLPCSREWMYHEQRKRRILQTGKLNSHTFVCYSSFHLYFSKLVLNIEWSLTCNVFSYTWDKIVLQDLALHGWAVLGFPRTWKVHALL